MRHHRAIKGCLSTRESHLAHPDVLEPIGPAVFLMEPRITVREAASDAATTLWRIGAIEEGDVLVADVTEPA